MIYISKLKLPSLRQEAAYITTEKRTYLGTFYPFKIFADKGLEEVKFDAITIFYGGNGSGKSTLINVMANKMDSIRYSDFNDAPLFDTYTDMCDVEYYKMPRNSYVLTSDDVFDYEFNARSVNESLGERRNEIVNRYLQVHEEYRKNPKARTQIRNLQGIDDFERWKEVSHILSPKKSMSSLVRKKVERDVNLGSNGETAIQYFVDRIDKPGVYFLDEPENSLSIEFQTQLVEYIIATARASSAQFVIATHSPIFLSIDNARIYNLDSYPAEICNWTELPNVRKYYDFFMEHRDEFEDVAALEDGKSEVKRILKEKELRKPRLRGVEYSKRLESFSYDTIALIADVQSCDRETVIKVSDITTNPALDEGEIVEQLTKLKQEFLRRQAAMESERLEEYEDARTLGVDKSSPYRAALMKMINYVNQEIGIEESDQVLIVISLDTEEKIQRWFDWIISRTDEELGVQASAKEIVRAAVKIGKGVAVD